MVVKVHMKWKNSNLKFQHLTESSIHILLRKLEQVKQNFSYVLPPIPISNCLHQWPYSLVSLLLKHLRYSSNKAIVSSKLLTTKICTTFSKFPRFKHSLNLLNMAQYLGVNFRAFFHFNWKTTLLCSFLLYNIVNRACLYIYPLCLEPPSHHPPPLPGCHRKLNWALCTIEHLPTSYLFYTASH